LNFSTVEINTPKIPEEEYLALVDFYNAMNGPSWSSTNQWNISENNLHEGAWPNVTITNGHITGLSFNFGFGSATIARAIPASFGNLKYLKTFSISSSNTRNLSLTDLNVFSGLDSLTSLTMEYCSLQGNIPASWARLKKIETLILNNNSLSVLPAQISEMTSLKTINVSYNRIETVNKSLANLPLTTANLSFQTINFPVVEISGGDLTIELPDICTYAITAGVGSFYNRNEFGLYINNNTLVTRNYATDDGILTFKNVNQYGVKVGDQIRINQISGAAINTNINYAALSFGQPLVEDEYIILQQLYTATNGAGWTQKWNIAANNLHETSWYGVGMKNGHVISLALPGNNLTGTLPEVLGGLSQLEQLNLSSNLITGSIPVGLSNLKSLKILNLQGNKFGGVIPAGLSNITTLTRLYLSDNLFSGTIPVQLNQFANINILDLSGNGFDALATPFTYNLDRVYLNIRGQSIQRDEYLAYSLNSVALTLPFINAYDEVARDYNGKYLFALQANGSTVAEATSDGKTLIFPDVNIMSIPEGAQITVLQRSGAARDAIIKFNGINNNSTTPVIQTEYLALVKLYQQAGGAQWKEPWDVSTNNIHQVKWKGIIANEGHIVGIDLSDNNLTGVIPVELAQLPELRSLILKQNKLSGEIPSVLAGLSKLTNIDLSENELTGLNTAFPSAVNLKIDRQNITMNTLALTVNSDFFDNSINRYDHATGVFGNQSYNLSIGSFNRTVSVPSTGLKLISLMSQWNIPNNQTMTLRQVGGAARNSELTYTINYIDGDANMDGAVNVLDIQANINIILSQSQQYFNFGAGDLNKDGFVNLLDIILMITKIQESSIQGAPSQPSDEISEYMAVLSIEDEILYLENPNQKTGSFDIRMKGIEMSKIIDIAQQQGYTLAIADRNGETVIIGFTSGDCVTGKIAIAKVSDSAEIVDALISDENAEAVSYTVKTVTGLQPATDDNRDETVTNYPNPFSNNTIIKYYLPENANRVTLKVFASDGQQVRIVDNLETSRGEHEILFMQNNLTAGIYIYQVEVYSQGQLRIYKNKMIVS
jgi:Leucine-rich repeat (LRR) protein